MKAPIDSIDGNDPKDGHVSANDDTLELIPLYPLRFEPIFEYRIWGGRRLANLLSTPLPGEDPIGEVWLLSDRSDHPSQVADGPLKGKTISQLMAYASHQMLGTLASHYSRFPLLLKFLDVRTTLSVQVHPSDAHAELLPEGESGKTEAWVVLEKGSDARIYAGLKPDATADTLRQAVIDGVASDQLTSFAPELGDSIFLRAGTVHALSDAVVFEVQENSDVTFRLFDWEHIDPKTGQRRSLQVDQALACINFKQGEILRVNPQVEESKPVLREKLIRCDHFGVWRISGESPFTIGKAGTPRILVCIAGDGQLEHLGINYPFSKGDVLLLPAVVGACPCHPNGAFTVLEIRLPEIVTS